MSTLGERIYFPILGGGWGEEDIFNCLYILNVEVLPLSEGIGAAGLNKHICSEAFWRRNPCEGFFSHRHGAEVGRLVSLCTEVPWSVSDIKGCLMYSDIHS